MAARRRFRAVLEESAGLIARTAGLLMAWGVPRMRAVATPEHRSCKVKLIPWRACVGCPAFRPPAVPHLRTTPASALRSSPFLTPIFSTVPCYGSSSSSAPASYLRPASASSAKFSTRCSLSQGAERKPAARMQRGPQMRASEFYGCPDLTAHARQPL